MKDTIDVFWFSEQPYAHITDEDLEPYESGRLGFPNTFFDPQKAHVLYNQYHEQYALADEVGFDGIMSNEHHSSYWCMKPAVNLDAAVIAKVTKKAKIAILGNVIAVNDPVRMAGRDRHVGLLLGRQGHFGVCAGHRSGEPRLEA